MAGKTEQFLDALHVLAKGDGEVVYQSFHEAGEERPWGRAVPSALDLVCFVASHRKTDPVVMDPSMPANGPSLFAAALFDLAGGQLDLLQDAGKRTIRRRLFRRPVEDVQGAIVFIVQNRERYYRRSLARASVIRKSSPTGGT